MTARIAKKPSGSRPLTGAAALGLWPLDPGVTYLNHGGYGATPLEVLAAQQGWRDRIERNPTGFLAREITAAQRQAAGEVAAALGAAEKDLVFVENATAGINAVLRSLRLEPGDDILILGLAYPAVRKAARFVAERAGARLVEVPLPLPLGDGKAIVEAVSARLGNRTRLALFDHIGAAAALRLPVEELIRRAKSAGARVLIDGAHAPGQIALDLPTLGADWYVGNLHKWYFAPRACGILWASPAAQEGLHPLSISHGYESGFREEFDWTGTRDFTAALAAPAGIAFHNRLGGAALMARNTALCREAAAMLARAWGTETGAPLDAFQAMATVRLPRGGDPRAFVAWLAETHRIETTAAESGGALWLRIAAQAYNEMADYERLAAAVTKGP